ncbi:MAG: hypothetical protein HGA45_30615 [Chloroflexales bacterium]|nr:hypothetical protein [Chloroflexales bacterium]
MSTALWARDDEVTGRPNIIRRIVQREASQPTALLAGKSLRRQQAFSNLAGVAEGLAGLAAIAATEGA